MRAWDPASQKKVRDSLHDARHDVPDSKRMFGMRERGRPGATSSSAARCLGRQSQPRTRSISTCTPKNDGKTAYRLTVKDVPVDGFWSVIVYDEAGYFTERPEAYSLNNLTAKKDADGSVTIHFGGDASGNFIPIVPDWNYMVRLYRPRKEILDGTWKFPEAQPAELERSTHSFSRLPT